MSKCITAIRMFNSSNNLHRPEKLQFCTAFGNSCFPNGDLRIPFLLIEPGPWALKYIWNRFKLHVRDVRNFARKVRIHFALVRKYGKKGSNSRQRPGKYDPSCCNKLWEIQSNKSRKFRRNIRLIHRYKVFKL